MKIGLSSCCVSEIDESFLKNCSEAGVDCIEISLKRMLCDDYNYETVKFLADKYNIELWSYHLPFAPFATNDISSDDEEIRVNSVERHKTLIRTAGKLGIKHFIVHPSAEPIEIGDRRNRLFNSRKSLSELADEAEKFNAVICVEDLPRTCLGRNSYEICELIKDDSRLKVCFDTNHLLGEYITDFIHKVGSRIATVHISDYDFWNERHWLPGEGEIDWTELYKNLKEVGYEGPWMYEIGFNAPVSIIRDRELTPADFVRNANEIANGDRLTVLGKPVEDMKFKF